MLGNFVGSLPTLLAAICSVMEGFFTQEACATRDESKGERDKRAAREGLLPGLLLANEQRVGVGLGAQLAKLFGARQREPRAAKANPSAQQREPI